MPRCGTQTKTKRDEQASAGPVWGPALCGPVVLLFALLRVRSNQGCQGVGVAGKEPGDAGTDLFPSPWQYMGGPRWSRWPRLLRRRC